MSKPTPRPLITPKIVKDAAHALDIDHLEEWEFVQVAQAYNTLRSADYTRINGYQLARELDDTHNWYICEEEVKHLGRLSIAIDETHRRICWKWAREQNIQPPLPIGSTTTQGEITGVSAAHPATYEIRSRATGLRRLVHFEDAIPTIEDGGAAA